MTQCSNAADDKRRQGAKERDSEAEEKWRQVLVNSFIIRVAIEGRKTSGSVHERVVDDDFLVASNRKRLVGDGESEESHVNDRKPIWRDVQAFRRKR